MKDKFITNFEEPKKLHAVNGKRLKLENKKKALL